MGLSNRMRLDIRAFKQRTHALLTPVTQAIAQSKANYNASLALFKSSYPDE